MFSYFGFSSKPNNTHNNDNLGTEANGGHHEHKEDDQDSEPPPMFPAQDSIQRSTGGGSRSKVNNPILKIDSADDDDENEDGGDDYLQAIDSLDLENLALPPSTLQKPKKPRKKVQLMPGFSQLDWAKLKASGVNLRGEEVTGLRKITMSELAEHKSKEDAWSSFNGKVYNITPYLNYHPGGVRELMRVAGKDGTELFMKTHAWISIDAMLDSCLLGFLVRG